MQQQQKDEEKSRDHLSANPHLPHDASLCRGHEDPHTNILTPVVLTRIADQNAWLCFFAQTTSSSSTMQVSKARTNKRCPNNTHACTYTQSHTHLLTRSERNAKQRRRAYQPTEFTTEKNISHRTKVRTVHVLCVCVCVCTRACVHNMRRKKNPISKVNQINVYCHPFHQHHRHHHQHHATYAQRKKMCHSSGPFADGDGRCWLAPRASLPSPALPLAAAFPCMHTRARVSVLHLYMFVPFLPVFLRKRLRMYVSLCEHHTYRLYMHIQTHITCVEFVCVYFLSRALAHLCAGHFSRRRRRRRWALVCKARTRSAPAGVVETTGDG